MPKPLLTFSALASVALAACASSPKTEATQAPTEVTVDPKLAAFLQAQTQQLKTLDRAAGLSWYQASISGKDEDFARSKAAEDALNAFYADADRFAQVKRWRQAGVDDAVQARQVEVLYLHMLGKQVAPELLSRITGLEKKVEKLFNTYRGQVDSQAVSNNEIQKILRESTDSTKLKAAWEAQKAVGPQVAPTLLELVKLRNQVAQSLGYRDFYALRIAESEQDEEALLALFDRLDDLTREPFAKLKAEVDRRLAARLKIPVEQLMPWHYQNPFFQEPPEVFDTGLDAIYKKQDTLALCKKFYESLDLQVDDIIARSDLYEKEGKSPHAFAIDIDREGDVRVLANIVPGKQWQGTMIHELGHAVYDEYIDHDLPWLLRGASHALTTEGLAMMIDRLVGNPRWAQAMGLIDEGEQKKRQPEADLYLAFASLQFSRWTQVMLRFERELYRDPSQDLDTLWWDLVEKYQRLRRPPGRTAPDYASKIHLVIVPVYYHNYMMGELFGAQVHEAIAAATHTAPADEIYLGKPEVGQFLRSRIFAPGKRYRWDELTRRATGTELGAEAFARRFADIALATTP